MSLLSPALAGRFFGTESNHKHFSGLLPDTKHFTFINSFNLCNNLMKWLILFCPEKEIEAQRMKTLPEVTQLRVVTLESEPR